MQFKTIKMMNQEAGETLAFTWLRGCENILSRADGSRPCPLSQYTRDDARRSMNIDESFYKHNSRWFLSEKNYPHILNAALACAQNVLRYLPDEYPLTLAHFTTPQKEVIK